MQQPVEQDERRLDHRAPRAFSFWVCPLGTKRRIGAWMLDMSVGGAAFLVAAPDAPPVGQLLEFREMVSNDPTVREDALPLPMYARVLRHDDTVGVTCRVAVRFEAPDAARIAAAARRIAAAGRPQTRDVPTVPPPLTDNPAGSDGATHWQRVN